MMGIFLQPNSQVLKQLTTYSRQILHPPPKEKLSCQNCSGRNRGSFHSSAHPQLDVAYIFSQDVHCGKEGCGKRDESLDFECMLTPDEIPESGHVISFPVHGWRTGFHLFCGAPEPYVNITISVGGDNSALISPLIHISWMAPHNTQISDHKRQILLGILLSQSRGRFVEDVRGLCQ